VTGFEEERKIFVAGTAKVDVFARAGAAAYGCYRQYMYQALVLLQGELDGPFSQWLSTAQMAAEGGATSDELSSARRLVETYRKHHLGLESIGPNQTSKEDALSVLFMLAFQEWERDHSPRTAQDNAPFKASITYDIDNFSLLFIEFFGRGRDLVQLLKKCFGVP
jgi:hypothetical protein